MSFHNLFFSELDSWPMGRDSPLRRRKEKKKYSTREIIRRMSAGNKNNNKKTKHFNSATFFAFSRTLTQALLEPYYGIVRCSKGPGNG